MNFYPWIQAVLLNRPTNVTDSNSMSRSREISHLMQTWPPVQSTYHQVQTTMNRGVVALVFLLQLLINDLQVAPSPQHVEYLTPTSGLYNAPSPQDTAPRLYTVYSRPRPVASASVDHQTFGPYNNTPGQHGENPDVGVMSEPEEHTVTSLPGTNYANVTMAMENPYVDAVSELKETTITTGPGTNYANVTVT